MKGAIVYSSKTGNTKKVAEAIHDELDKKFELFSVDEDIDLDKFDTIFMGYWIDKGTADAKAMEFIKKIKGKKVAYFMTLGAYPDSDHGKKCVENGGNLFKENRILGNFICQGAIDPKLIEWMSSLPSDHPHAVDDSRRKRWKDASSRPNADDIENVRKFVRDVLKN